MKTIEIRPTLPQEQGKFDVVEYGHDDFGTTSATIATFYGQHAERNAAVFATALHRLFGKPNTRNIRRKK